MNFILADPFFIAAAPRDDTLVAVPGVLLGRGIAEAIYIIKPVSFTLTERTTPQVCPQSESIAMQPKFLRTTDAAAYLGMSKSHLEKLRVFGGGPRYSKVGRGRGGRVIYRVDDLDSYAAQHARTSTSEPMPGATP